MVIRDDFHLKSKTYITNWVEKYSNWFQELGWAKEGSFGGMCQPIEMERCQNILRGDRFDGRRIMFKLESIPELNRFQLILGSGCFLG